MWLTSVSFLEVKLQANILIGHLVLGGFTRLSGHRARVGLHETQRLFEVFLKSTMGKNEWWKSDWNQFLFWPLGIMTHTVVLYMKESWSNHCLCLPGCFRSANRSVQGQKWERSHEMSARECLLLLPGLKNIFEPNLWYCKAFLVYVGSLLFSLRIKATSN